MDAFKLIPEAARSDAYWTGSLSTTIAIAAQYLDHRDHRGAKKLLRSQLAEFIASPVPSEELRVILRGYLK